MQRLYYLGFVLALGVLISICVMDVKQVRAQDISIDDAYRAVPKERVPFDMSISKMSAPEAQYVDHLFYVTDLALRERIVMLRYFEEHRSADYIDEYNAQIDELLSSFLLIKAPSAELKKVEDLVINAIKAQRQFFNARYQNGDDVSRQQLYGEYRQDQWVQKSHRGLIQAFQILKRTYNKEGQHNQQSFYNHLCALDFI